MKTPGKFLFFLVTFSIPLFSQSTEDLLRIVSTNSFASARAGGLGSSFYGVSDDASAARYNPAGLSLLRHSEFALAFGMYRSSQQCVYGSSDVVETNQSIVPSYISYAVPSHLGSLRAGISLLYNKEDDYRSSFSFADFNPTSSIVQSMLSETVTPTDNLLYRIHVADTINGRLISPVRDSMLQRATVRNDRGRHSVIVGFGLLLKNNVRLGISIGSTWSSLTYTRSYSEQDTKNKYNFLDTSASFANLDLHRLSVDDRLEQTTSAMFLRVGMMATLGDWGRASLSIAPPLRNYIQENFTRTATATFDDDISRPYTQSATGQNEYGVTSPWDLGCAFSASVAGVTSSISLQYRDYSQSSFSDNAEWSPGGNDSIRTQLREQIQWSAGFEYNPSFVPITLRASIENISSAYISTIANNGLTTYAFGLGVFLNDQVRLDALGRFSSNSGNYIIYGDGSEASYSLTSKPSQYALQCSYRF